MEIDVLKLKEDLENNKIKLIDVRESYELKHVILKILYTHQ